MALRCPACGSENIRSSLSQTLTDEIGKVFGFFKLRCKDCDHRFSHFIWDAVNSFWARCPRCYRQDLGTWSVKYYRAPTRWLVLMKLGAKRYRCEYCRHNFIDFRRAKFKYRGRGRQAGAH